VNFKRVQRTRKPRNRANWPTWHGGPAATCATRACPATLSRPSATSWLSCDFSTWSLSNRAPDQGGTRSKSGLGNGTWQYTHEVGTCPGLCAVVVS